MKRVDSRSRNWWLGRGVRGEGCGRAAAREGLMRDLGAEKRARLVLAAALAGALGFGPCGAVRAQPHRHPRLERPSSYWPVARVSQGDVVTSLSVVALPSVAPIRAITGTYSPDVWLLAEDGELLRVKDGARVERLGRPCHESGLLASAELALPSKLRVTLGRVILAGQRPLDQVTDYESRVLDRRTGEWSCDLGPHEPHPDLGTSMLGVAVLPETVWVLTSEGPAALAGPPPPLPTTDGITTYFEAQNRAHAWLATSTCTSSGERWCWHSLWEYRGVSWLERPSPGFGVTDLVEDDSGRVWALGVIGRRSVLSRFTRSSVGGSWAWTPVAVPADFAASEIIGGNGDELWLRGDTHLFWRTASRIAASPLPLDLGRPMYVTASWISPANDLWLAGHDGQGHGMLAVDNPEAGKP